MSEEHSFKIIELEERMQMPNPEELIFMNVCRVSGYGQKRSLEVQEAENIEDLKTMGATIYPELVVKFTQSTKEGTDRVDFAKMKRLREFGVKIDGNTLIPNAIINRDFDGRLKVYIGRELGCPQLDNCSLIVSSYRIKNRPRGRLAVLGPLRMQYSHIIPTLEYISDVLSDVLDNV